jgi:DNA-binding CsgD family transcriptional regulator
MDRTGMNMLTQRELDVVALLAAGLTDDEIEERLGLPPVTAAAIVERLALWLGVRGRTQVTEWTRTLGLPAPVVATDETAPEPRELPMDTPSSWWKRWLYAVYG